MKAPEFWESGKGGAPALVLSLLLSPLGWAYGALTRLRLKAARPWRATVPVICIGNLTAGGAGKTPVALNIAGRIREKWVNVHFVSRGYGGRLAGPVRVDPESHTFRDVGDEALLLARACPTWVGRDRVRTCRAAIENGAEAIIMDDGFQNPGVAKDLSLLVVDGAYGFGNGRMIPAGPLREPVAQGLRRADAVILIGVDSHGTQQFIANGANKYIPVLRAHVKPGPEGKELIGQPVVAFAGIGHPQKFFNTLLDLGCRILKAHPFPDHHRFSPGEVEAILREAGDVNALPITTEKDSVRIAPQLADRVKVLTIRLEWEDETTLDTVLQSLECHGR
ncbi:MAG: tetraacyldisaccharide 4'-kinase [Rhodospirillales bacterium]|nr:tetraacyldisaccharide 4'-kinase [Rhodospirillales bacterium]